MTDMAIKRKEPGETHPDDFVQLLCDLATEYGYGLESVTLTWVSGIPSSGVMRLEYPSRQHKPPRFPPSDLEC